MRLLHITEYPGAKLDSTATSKCNVIQRYTLLFNNSIVHTISANCQKSSREKHNDSFNFWAKLRRRTSLVLVVRSRIKLPPWGSCTRQLGRLNKAARGGANYFVGSQRRVYLSRVFAGFCNQPTTAEHANVAGNNFRLPLHVTRAYYHRAITLHLSVRRAGSGRLLPEIPARPLRISVIIHRRRWEGESSFPLQLFFPPLWFRHAWRNQKLHINPWILRRCTTAQTNDIPATIFLLLFRPYCERPK